MGAWIKVFTDNSTEVGTDAQITHKQASWSQGKLTDIHHVQIYENRFGICCTLENTKWHQFDRFISFLDQLGPQCNRVFRCIQVQIQQNHVGQYIIVDRIQFVYFVTLGDNKTDFVITDEHVGKWLTLKISHKGKFSIMVSEKGMV
jgi:hypothetical protein